MKLSDKALCYFCHETGGVVELVKYLLQALQDRKQLLGALLVAVGVALVALGATGGIAKYQIFVPDTLGRVSLGAMGFFVGLAGIVLNLASEFRRDDGRGWISRPLPKYIINWPPYDSQVELPCRVHGTGVPIPEHTEVYWFTMIGGGHWPQDKITLTDGNWSLYLKEGHFGGINHVKVGLFLVGDDGQKVIENYKHAGEQIRTALAKVGAPTSTPGIQKLTSDMKILTDERHYRK